MTEMKKVISQEDIRTAANVIRESFGTVAESHGFTTENSPSFPAFITSEQLGGVLAMGLVLFLLLDDGVPTGTIGYKKHADSDYTLEKLAVLPEFRHKGYGKLLVEYIENLVREEGGKIIKLAIVEENTVLKDWYLSLGYRHVETKKFEHLVFTAGFMEKEI